MTRFRLVVQPTPPPYPHPAQPQPPHPTPTPTHPQGIHVVTPNKKLNSGPLADYLAVKQLQRSGRAHYMYEVGQYIGEWGPTAGCEGARM